MPRGPKGEKRLAASRRLQSACFVVRDHGGQALAYVYFEDEPGGGRRQSCSHAMRRSGSQRISLNCPRYYGSRSYCGQSQ
jgi:hypothetical protein